MASATSQTAIRSFPSRKPATTSSEAPGRRSARTGAARCGGRDRRERRCAERTKWRRRTRRYATPNSDRVVSESARHREGDAEHRGHRAEHRQADAALVDIHRARQPRVDGPRPPERREDEHPAEDPAPGRVVREHDRDLGDREHEDQVEEELERRDLVLGVWRGLRARRRARPRCRIRFRSGVAALPCRHPSTALAGASETASQVLSREVPGELARGQGAHPDDLRTGRLHLRRSTPAPPASSSMRAVSPGREIACFGGVVSCRASVG